MTTMDPYDALSDAYMAAVGDIAALLDHARQQIAAGDGENDDAALVNRLFAHILPLWRASIAKAASAARPLRNDPSLYAVARDYAQALLLPALRPGPIWERSYTKPRGYPGDYGIMNFVYDRTDAGDGAYAHLCHRLGLDIGDCVRTRMLVVAEALVDQLGMQGDVLRSLSLGCGSAREVAAALSGALPNRRARFVLVDQDAEALASARQHIERAVPEDANGRVDVDYVNLPFGQLFKDFAALEPWRGQDIVYCMGLLDYVADEQLGPLVRVLFSLVRPGGLLVLGNMKEPTATFWPLECILDWRLIYRTEGQMLALSEMRGVDQTALSLEETGNNYILKLRKCG